MKKKILIILIAWLPILLNAATLYVRQGATGNGSGTDWTNAFTSLPATLVRGNVYYIAGGTYNSYTFDDAESGSSVITIIKATETDHGTHTGWQTAYGSAQAVFNGFFKFTRGYYVINGQTRDESDWFDGSAYGIQIKHNITNIKICKSGNREGCVHIGCNVSRRARLTER